MKNTFGQHLAVTLFGESHGAAIGAVLDGLCPGMPVDEENIRRMLRLRQPDGEISTARKEADTFEILSGVCGGITTGTPLTILIRNTDTKSDDYTQLEALMRPGHADYTAHIKYGGYQDGVYRAVFPKEAELFVSMLAAEDRRRLVEDALNRCGGVNARFEPVLAKLIEMLQLLLPEGGPFLIALDVELYIPAGPAAGGTVDDISCDAFVSAEWAVPVSHDELSHINLLYRRMRPPFSVPPFYRK